MKKLLENLLYAPIRSQNQRQQAERARLLDARRQASSVRKEKQRGRGRSS